MNNNDGYYLEIGVDVPTYGRVTVQRFLGPAHARKFERAVDKLDAYAVDYPVGGSECLFSLRLLHIQYRDKAGLIADIDKSSGFWESTPKSTWDEARAELVEQMESEPTYNKLAGR